MGSFQLPALIGAAAEEAGPLGGTVKTTETAVKSAEQLGQEGEAAVRSVYDIGPRTAIKVGHRRLTPDGLIPGESLSEIKNRGYQGWTTQLRNLRNYSTYTQQESIRFNLYVRGSNAPGGATRLGGFLQEEISKDRINLMFIPGTE